MAEARLCETPDCNNPAKLRCPTCIKMDIEGSYFCNQVSRMYEVYVRSHTVIGTFRNVSSRIGQYIKRFTRRKVRLSSVSALFLESF